MALTELLNGADLALLALVAVFGIWGWKSGLVKMCFRLVSFGVSLVLAWILYPVLAEYFRTTVLYDRIFAMAEKKLEHTGQPAVLPEFLQDAVRRAEASVNAGIANYFTQLVLNLLAFLLVLAVVWLLLAVVKRLLKLFVSLPVIGFLNHLAGLGLGIAEGFLIACILLAAVSAFVPLRENVFLQESLEHSVAVKYMVQENPVLHLLLPDSSQSI